MFRSFTLIGAASLAAVLGLTSASHAVVLANPGFEVDNASVNDVAGATGWGGFNDRFTTAATAHTGTQSLKIYGPFSQGGGAGVVQGAFAASPGQLWSATAFAENFSGDPMLGANFAISKIEFLGASGVLGAFESPQINSTTPQNTWVPLTASGIAPAGTTGVQLVLVHVQLNSPVTGGSVFFDDASLAQVIPEPATLSALAGGGLMVLRRRRRA